MYELVHSLTKAEKRYFRHFASLHVIGEKNNYLRLFEVIGGQKQFDEASISAPFKGLNFYLLKRHLQKSLLRSLREFHAASSITIRINTLVNEVEVLYKKGFVKAALKLVHHAKKIASRHEQHPAILQLLEWEVKLLSLPRKLVSSYAKITRVFQEAEGQMELNKNFLNCFHFRMNVGALHNKEVIIRRSNMTGEQNKFIRSIHDLSARNLSKKAQWQLYSGAGIFFSTLGDYSQSNQYHKKAARIYEKNNFLITDDLRQYLLSLYTQSISDFNLKKYEEALGNLQIIRDVLFSLTKKQNVQELFLHALLLEGFILMDMGKYKKALPVIRELAGQMDIYGALVNTTLRTDFYYQMTGFWFCMGDYKQARAWLNKMLQDEDAPKENPARYRFARLMQLLVLFELREFHQVENLLPASRKFLRKKGQLYKIEEVILSFIASYVRNKEMISKKEHSLKFVQLKKKLQRLAKDKKEGIVLKIFNYADWADSNIRHKTIAGVAVEEQNHAQI